MATFFRTLGEYLRKDKQFVVPNYQRGYKWAVEWEEPKDDYISHVDKLCGDLIKAFTEKKKDYFLQGITVSERENQIILIDGQQRTTTLYLLLWCLDKSEIKNIKLVYDIRTQSKAYIENLQKDDFDYNSV
jgi:uncharacterized protein with ParB-like and HNH nuclease domain